MSAGKAAPRTLTLVHRRTGEIGTVLDVTGMSPTNFEQMYAALVRKVDFETWGLVNSDDPWDPSANDQQRTVGVRE